jgi:hypothetical protein
VIYLTQVAQNNSIDLREIDPLYDDTISAEEESAALVYQPLIRIARWMPAEEEVEGKDKMPIVCMFVVNPLSPYDLNCCGSPTCMSRMISLHLTSLMKARST